jgi:protein tyrosine/serine phosphatase
MDSIYRGSMATSRGRGLAWLDSMLVDHGVLRVVWTNFAPVVPGRLYRSNHPTPGRLARDVRRYGLRSVINLRGPTGNGSDALSREAAARLGLKFYDVPMSSGRAPSRERVQSLVAALQSAPGPALLHCKSGADRAGFAAAVFILMQGGSVAQALRQMSLRFGHLRRSRAGVLDAFLLRYAAQAEGRRPFTDWLHEEYDEAALSRDYVASGLASFLQTRLLARE